MTRKENAEVRALCAERINQSLREKGITAKELAKRTGLTEADISNYRHGRYAPKQDRIFLMAMALGVDPVWLWGLSDERHPDDEIDLLINNLTDKQREQAMEYMRFLILQGRTE